MHGRDLVRNFKGGSWGHSAQLEHFVREAGDVSAQDLTKLLDVLLSKQNSKEPPAALRNRCSAFSRLVQAMPDPNLFAPLVKGLKSANAPLRAIIVDLLPKVNHIPAHGELIAMMKAKDQHLRKAATTVLSQVGGKTTFEQLRVFIREPSFQGRAEAIDILLAGTKSWK